MDTPVVGVLTILFLGVLILVCVGSTSFLHLSAVIGGNAASHREPLQRHFEQGKMEPHSHSHHHHHDHDYELHERRQEQVFEEDPNAPRVVHRLSASSGQNSPGIDEEPDVAAALPSLPIRVIHGKQDTKNIYDVVVAGAGPSGLTAALFGSRAGLKVHVLGSAATGLLSQTKRLDNFPSFVDDNDINRARSGPDWVQETLAQAKSWGATFGPPGLMATSIERQRIAVGKGTHKHEHSEKDVFFALATGDKSEPEIRAWSVIVASGAVPRTLGLPGEDLMWGVSLHNCAICDGRLYQKTENSPSTVLVVGGGDAALDAALLLARYATKVILVHRREEFISAHNLVSIKEVRSTPNIEIMFSHVVHEWITKDGDPSQLVGAQLLTSDDSSAGKLDNLKRVEIDGAFVMIGATPNTEWTKNVGISLDEEGLIKTTANLPLTMNRMSSGSMITASSIPGLFAAGEVTDSIYKQAITAAAAGAQAAIDAERWLREQRGVTGMSNSVAGNDNHASNTRTDLRKMDHVAAAANSEQGDIQSDSDHTPVNCDLVSEDCIRSIVAVYPVVVFSKSFCPYCRKALEALSLAGVSEGSDKLLVIELTKHSNTQDIQSTLQQMTGRRTVPNVFVAGTSIGGGDETHALQQSGKLKPMLVEAGALGDHKDIKEQKAEEWKNIQQDKSEARRKAVEEEKKNPTIRESSSESCDLSSEECFLDTVKKYPVLLFSLSWCPECKRLLELLDRIGVTKDKVHIIDLEDHEEIALDIRAHMKALTGRRYVPNLFLGGEFVGGFGAANGLHHEGDLEQKLQILGVL